MLKLLLVIPKFWSSGILTGNQTCVLIDIDAYLFWSSGILTGNQTTDWLTRDEFGFGAVAF